MPANAKIKGTNMSKFNAHPYVPAWIEAMNGELLSSTELDILNFIHYCKKYGCRTSNDRIASNTHFSHATAQRTIMKLYRAKLIEIDNFGKRTRKLKPINWADRSEWSSWRDLFKIEHPFPAHNAPHITPPRQTTTYGSSLGGVDRNPPSPADEILPSNAGGLGGSRGGGIASPSYQLTAEVHRDKLLHVGHTRDQANRLALVKFPKAKFQEENSNGTAPR